MNFLLWFYLKASVNIDIYNTHNLPLFLVFFTDKGDMSANGHHHVVLKIAIFFVLLVKSYT
jgi:hypothetical protein